MVTRDFEWIKRVIKSCETVRQLTGTFKLISRFITIYPDEFEYSNLLMEAKEFQFSKAVFTTSSEVDYHAIHLAALAKHREDPRKFKD